MHRSATFGLVGGSGNTGIAIAEQLRRSIEKPIAIAARDFSKAQAVAAKLGGATSAAQIDVRNPQSLENFCARCDIVVNCAGPVCELQDRVAQAALTMGSHYVDVAGLTLVRERMLPHNDQLVARGLSCVVSAGWLPGMSELLPAYAFRMAKADMDEVHCMTIHFGDDGEWSYNAVRDAVWYLRKFGRRRPQYMQRGQWVRAKFSEVLNETNLETPMGRCLFAMSCLPEMEELIDSELRGCDTRACIYLPSSRTAAVGSLLALVPIPTGLAVPVLRQALRAPSLAIGGFSIVAVHGSRGGREVWHRHQVTFDKQREYWMSAVVAATVARLLAEGRAIKPGVHFLVDAVDPIAFMEELRNAGVTNTQSFSAEVSERPTDDG